MFRKVLSITLLFLLLFSGAAHAESAKIIATDMVYGAAIGTLLGAAVYVFDQDDLGDKLMYGAALGTIGGFVVGAIDVQNNSIVEIEKNKIDINAPSLVLEERVDPLDRTSDFRYRVSLLNYSY